MPAYSYYAEQRNLWQHGPAMNDYADKRLAPQSKLALHTQFAEYMSGKRVYPINLEISPSGICQASCDFCFYANTGELGHHRNVMLDTERAKFLLLECQELGIKSVSWTGGGEPTLHPHFEHLVETARYAGLEQGLFTNALAAPKYDPQLLAWVRVTMTDKPFRPDYIKALRTCKTVGIAFNYSGPQDDAYLRDVLAMAVECQVSYVQCRPALKFHGETTDIEPPSIVHPLLHITAYKFDEARKPHGTHYATCEGYHLSPMCWEDGNVDICSYMRQHEGFTLGNIYKQTLKEILDAAPQDVPVHKCCQVACRLHETNRMIHASRRIEDRNFP
jgi:hypothetical protein